VKPKGVKDTVKKRGNLYKSYEGKEKEALQLQKRLGKKKGSPRPGMGSTNRLEKINEGNEGGRRQGKPNHILEEKTEQKNGREGRKKTSRIRNVIVLR